ncbi:MAG: translocation/assembly module TamB domain-containing protein [Ignavibacteria bacterium]|nr:translocation/assembly module TamB domain-containing protein [Ignavibacteria bacterium]
MAKNVIKKAAKIMLWLTGSVIFLLIAIIIFIQTDKFNEIALEFTLDELNSAQKEKMNTINAESIEGNIFSGIKLNNGNITVKNDTLLKFGHLSVKYDIWGLLDKKILLKEVVLNDPFIFASQITSGDSLIWNFENLFTQDMQDTTPSSPFDWDVDVGSLKINNGFIRVRADSSKPAEWWKEKRTLTGIFDITETDITDLNIELNAVYYTDYKSINISNISFNTNSPLSVKKLKLNANLNEKDTTTDLWGFELETNRSDIKIYRLYADKFNPFYEFRYDELGNKDIKASIDIQKFNFDDLTFFIPGLGFLDSTVSVKLDAEGKYGDLNARILNANLKNTRLSFSGNIKNLQMPESLYFDITGKDLLIDPAEINSVYLEELPVPKQTGIINGDINYKGTYYVFSSDFRFNSAAGTAEGRLNLDLPNEIYSGEIFTYGLNTGAVLSNRELNGYLNLSAKFSGKGFDINRMNTSLNYSIINSKIGKYNITRSAGMLKNTNGNIKLNILHTSGMGNAEIAGSMNIRNISNPTYDLSGKIRGADISAITGAASDKSSINADFKINGSGISPGSMNGTYIVKLDESSYGEYYLPATQIDAELRNTGSQSNIKINSEAADIYAEGSLNFDELIDAVLFNIDHLNKQITQSIENNNQVNEPKDIIIGNSVNSINSESGLKFTIVTKDSIKLQKVLKPFGVDFAGNVNGSITNSAEGFNLAADLRISRLNLQDSVLKIVNSETEILFSNRYTGNRGDMDIEFNTVTDKITLGQNSFDSAAAKLKMNGNNAELNLKTKADTSGLAEINGNFSLAPGVINANIDTFRVNYSGFDIRNSGNWIFSFQDADRFELEQFDIRSKNAVLKLSGVFALNSSSELKVTGDNINIQDIASIINKADSSYIISEDRDIEGEIENLDITFTGTLEEPEISAKMNTDLLRYEDNDIGRITASMKFMQNTADAEIVLQNAEGDGTLTVKGNAPLQNPLSGDTAGATEFTNAPVDINLSAKNFMLDYFALLIPDAASLRGVLNADLSAKGTASDPALTGNLKITNGGYLIPLTGMYHSFDASMSTDNFKLVLDNLRIYNEDDDSRHIDLFGTLDFRDMKIKDIDISATGDMVLLDKDVEQNELGVYGYILAGMGEPPLKINGSLDSLFITGQLLIKDATISSVPLEGTGYNADEDNFIYANRFTDTAAVNPDSLTVLEPEEYNNINPFDRYKYKVTGDSVKSTFVHLDFNVKTENTVYASIDFNNLTRDRLFGELTADLDIKTENGIMQAYGRVDVGGDSYYRFYRDFKLDESNITFDGDISNPVLDIKGVYSSEKNIEQYGTVSSATVEVVITIKGNVKEPELTLNLFQDGSQVSGSDAQSDAITYLLFGRYKSELTASERTSVASSLGASVGSLYASSYLSQTVREILPFIVDAQFSYTEGNVKDTDVELISELGDARVKFGGKLLKDVKNFELVVDYPLNRLLNLNLPETVLLEFAREEKEQTLSISPADKLTTEIKILYKIKF